MWFQTPVSQDSFSDILDFELLHKIKTTKRGIFTFRYFVIVKALKYPEVSVDYDRISIFLYADSFMGFPTHSCNTLL